MTAGFPFGDDPFAAPTVETLPQLVRVHLRLSPVTALHVDITDPRDPPVIVRGVARVSVERDEFARLSHRFEWDPRSDGARFEIEEAAAPDPRVADVMRRLDGGERAARVGDPVALLAAEVRRLRGERGR